MIPFIEAWNTSKEIDQMNSGLVLHYPRGTECCLYCDLPKETRTLDDECGSCFSEERCGCKWCDFYYDHRCMISLKLDLLRHHSIGFCFYIIDVTDDKGKKIGVYVEITFVRRFSEWDYNCI